jgi:hypothetical protein
MNSGGPFYVNSGSVTFNTGAYKITALYVNTAGSVTVTGTLTVNDSLIITAANGMIGGAITVRRNLVNNCTSMPGTKTMALTLNGAGIQILRQAAGAIWPAGAFTISKDSGRVVLGSDVSLPSGFTVAKGTLDQGPSYNLTTGGLVTIGTGSALINRGTGDLTLSGDINNNGALILNSSGGLGGDADGILVRSSSNGTVRYWTGTGSYSLFDVDIKDMNISPGQNAYSSTNSTNNTGITFADYTDRF